MKRILFLFAIAGMSAAVHSQSGTSAGLARVSGELPFKTIQIDGGAAESAAIADFNNDGKLDIVSAENWYEAPTWIKRPIRTIPVTNGYVDSFSDLPLDVDGDGFMDVIQIGYFARRIVWAKNPGKSGSAWTENLIDAVGPTEFAFVVDLDINGDGRNDVLTTSAHSYGLCWFEQRADGSWPQHVIDNSWSHAHASVLADMNGDGQPDRVTGKRYMARNAPAPGDEDPLGLYWYEFKRMARGGVEWTRHTIAYGGKAGGGLQIVVRDMDGDGDMDVVSAGKSGLFLEENKAK